jgi:hypothetical protein
MAKKSQLETKQTNIENIRKSRGGGKDRIRGIKSLKKYIRANMPAATGKLRVKKLRGKNLTWKNKGSNLPIVTNRLRVKEGEEAVRKQIINNRIGKGRQHNKKGGRFNYCFFTCTLGKNSQTKRETSIRNRKVLCLKEFIEIMSNFLNVAKTGNYDKHV